MREVTLPSGAILKITPSPFKEAKALYQALLKEGKTVQLANNMDMSAVYKDLFCLAFSSAEIERCLWKCFERCTYNDLRITEDTFEPITAREDYTVVSAEVARENTLPFLKSLYAEFQKARALLTSGATPA